MGSDYDRQARDFHLANRQRLAAMPGIYPAFPRITVEMIGQLGAAMSMFNAAAVRASAAFKVLSGRIYEMACDAYRKEFGRLPASDRTSRLRKKRRKMVMYWFLEEGGGAFAELNQELKQRRISRYEFAGHGYADQQTSQVS